MFEPIFSPLNYYLNTAKETHSKFTREYLDLLFSEAKVDREANAQTVSALNTQETTLQSLHKKASGQKTLRVLMIVGICLAYLTVAIFTLLSTLNIVYEGLILLTCLGLAIFGIVSINKKLKAKIQHLNEQINDQQAKVDTLRDTAWQQAAPLNTLFKEDDSLNLFNKTLPFITFDKCFTDTRFNELVNNHGFPARLCSEDCALDTLSGELYGNPFVYVQKLSHRMGTKTYHGSLVISWTTMERNSDGKMTPRRHTQTLHATIVRPAPYYNVDTALYFGHEAAPNLNFSRTYAHVEDKSDAAVARTVRKGEKKLKKLEEKALKIGDDFQGVTNTEFDVLFGAMDRTNDLEFLQMFTPRAQESMLELLLYEDGYGDDFSFSKNGNLCVIRSEHAQGNPLYPTAEAYCSYDISAAENNFIKQNENFFLSVYFDFAPLLLIPLYQQPLVRSEPISQGNLTAYNYEAFAYKLSSSLAPDNAKTESIFKTRLKERTPEEDTVEVCAFAYDTEECVHYESVYGGDGRFHAVPVYWTQYIPTEKTSILRIVKGKTNETPDGGINYRGYYAYKA